MKTDTRITFHLPPKERRELERLGKARDLTLAQLARRGVRRVLAEEGERERVLA